MTNRTETRMRELRKMPLFRQVVPMEAGVGWPIPLRRGNRVFMVLPLYGYRPRPEKGAGTELYRPFATITLEWRTGRVVEYVDLAFSAPWPAEKSQEPVGTFPHEAAGGSPREYEEARKDLLRRYDELFEYLEQRDPIPGTFMDEFGALLGRLVEPSLLPYFRVLGKQFYARFPRPEGRGRG